jgi:hypothetical protein
MFGGEGLEAAASSPVRLLSNLATLAESALLGVSYDQLSCQLCLFFNRHSVLYDNASTLCHA